MVETQDKIKKVPLNDIHISLGGKMVPFAGFYMPLRYTSDIEEHVCVRQGVGVFDVSHMGEFLVRGPGALELIQKVSSNDASLLIDGKIQYSCLPNEQGGIVDDILVYRLSALEYLIVVNASNIEKDWKWINSYNSFGAELVDISNETSLFALQGPQASDVLKKLTTVPVQDLQYYSFVKGEVAGVKDVIISATGYTGAGGFELYVPNTEAAVVWEALFTAGQEFRIKPIGLGARDTLRLEMGYCLYGNDIDDTTSPLEAGLSRITKFTKPFVNSAFLEHQKREGVKRKLVGFEMIDRGIPRSHYEITDESGISVGQVTSGSQSPSLNKGIGMGYVTIDKSSPGVLIFINVRGKLLKAKVVKLPFLK